MDQQLIVLLRNSLWILIQTKVTKIPDSFSPMAVLKITSEPESTKFCDYVALELLFSPILFALMCEKVWHVAKNWFRSLTAVWVAEIRKIVWRRFDHVTVRNSSSGTVEPGILILRNSKTRYIQPQKLCMESGIFILRYCGTRYIHPQELWNEVYHPQKLCNIQVFILKSAGTRYMHSQKLWKRVNPSSGTAEQCMFIPRNCGPGLFILRKSGTR